MALFLRQNERKPSMKKSDILKILESSAIKYKENLANKNILFIYYENSKIEYIETKFLPSNFLHLTGITYQRKQNNNAINFYKDILDKKVSFDNLQVKDENIVKLKLNILEIVLNITYSAKMIGQFDATIKNLLITEKVVGNNRYSMGFIKVGGYYIPNTILKEDIRNITNKTNRIVAIFSKEIKEKYYSNLTYIEKKTNLWQIEKNKELMLKIDPKILFPKNVE